MNDQLPLFDTSVVNDLTQRIVFPSNFEQEVCRLDRMRARAHAEFSEENLCAAWLRNGFGDAEFWQHLSEREKVVWMARYQHERQLADCCYRGRMRTALAVLADEERRFQEEERMAERWAAEIKAAAVNRLPVPFSESEEMNGFERLCFRHRLARAFQLAGVVIVQSATEQEPTKGRRRAAKAA